MGPWTQASDEALGEEGAEPREFSLAIVQGSLSMSSVSGPGSTHGLGKGRPKTREKTNKQKTKALLCCDGGKWAGRRGDQGRLPEGGDT